MYIPHEHPKVDVQIRNLWQVFSVAEMLGDEKSVEAFYRDLMDAFGKDHYFLTAMYLVTNWKLWEAWEKSGHTETPLVTAYRKVFDDTRDHTLEVLKDRKDDLRFFWEVTD